MKFKFIDPNTKDEYAFEFYHKSYFKYYLLYTIYKYPFKRPQSSISSAFEIVNNMIEWSESYDAKFLDFSLEARKFCDKTIKRIAKNLAFL